MPRPKKTMWGEKRWLDLVNEQRAHIYNEDYLGLMAKYLGLRPGMTIADIGCGIGFVGITFARYIQPGGKVLGFDVDCRVIDEGRKNVRKRRLGKVLSIEEGDVYKLPLPDESVDLSVCQALLMHLDRPGDALSEMIRIVRPGGKVVCLEPGPARSAYVSCFKPTLQDRIEGERFEYHLLKGRKKLGRGDREIAKLIPEMMAERGLTEIRVRCSDRPPCLVPPYETPEQKATRDYILSQMQRHRGRYMKQRDKEAFLAGGGAEAEFERLHSKWLRQAGRVKQALKAGELAIVGSNGIPIVYGTKPRRPPRKRRG
jgi:ubiquinone/menaquinone biosynthesis C-methylase UbiE